jgi:glycosyltransferase involved in cell wall biosynthesis
MPKVSILIPTYNMADFLPVALESGLGQDYTDTEIIVVNDGSTDDTESAASPYLPHIRYQRQENQGLVATLNRGMEMAAGEYICFLDADDALCPHSVSAQVEQLERNPRVGLVFGRNFEMNSLGKVIGLHDPFPGVKRPTVVPSSQAFRWLLRGSSIQKSTVMIRRDAFKRAGPFQQQSWPGEDWDMWLRIAAWHDLAYIPRALAYRRVHRGSITAGSYTVDSFRGSHLHTLSTLFSRPDLLYGDLEGLAYAYLERSTALLAAQFRQRRVLIRYLMGALRRQPRMLAEKETWTCFYGGLKSLLPAPLLGAVRRQKRSVALRRGLLNRRAKPSERVWVREVQQRLRAKEEALKRW